MPRYFFSTNDGDFHHVDEDGHQVADLAAARRMALETLSGMARDSLTEDSDRQDFTVEVRDDTGHVVYTACLSLVARRLA